MDSKEHLETKIIQTKGADYMATVIAQKWGNSLGIRIPKEAAEKVGIKQGSEIELIIAENDEIITLKPKRLQKKYTLEDLLSQITPENRHNEIDFGSEGRELI
ncbi:AbrB/MazE/SpoVT family DNA-binding domain-containing protein [Clostridium thermosuccinogenes]|jgi:antitoxin MazE|uniref:AbrB/MazE/SpoVT family DNA-binding domain-containing protein n=1 Tax=Clostridium thermosuccinogenes TaxID=84032 RepID=A0A2K2F3I5_9CLOT|nr:AbrB/MazE/SpoVT family DNA-binding domain-containing protein [Pseudoclostridium thermosuccinogenes]AUS95958.1 AbrB/MazE/SpoVT family DNA-binding domain-containing protein [Pseudoclostridium thermosuccinogenes]PNT93326.1 AbrB/MazE/SpoVT family DNA-binding domain-containing protein [Pseudoclostridium thermosuccinogenes]PNT99347.1 AbrB/MazE/SpoVT family DNA-binding domain-containing protein [Pseudoclostridium thermosuccinogenes]PNU01034.1 AbrB/MazE/SpoVT family DNA-binding domain-containing pro